MSDNANTHLNTSMIKRSVLQRNFSIISNEILLDPKLTLEAKGLLCLMLSKSDDWIFYKDWLRKQSIKVGRDKFNRILNELKQVGYISIEQVKGEGKFKHSQWVISDVPQFAQAVEPPCTENTSTEKTGIKKPCTENTCTEKAGTENSLLLSTDVTKTDLTKVKTINTGDFSTPDIDSNINQDFVMSTKNINAGFAISWSAGLKGDKMKANQSFKKLCQYANDFGSTPQQVGTQVHSIVLQQLSAGTGKRQHLKTVMDRITIKFDGTMILHPAKGSSASLVEAPRY